MYERMLLAYCERIYRCNARILHLNKVALQGSGERKDLKNGVGSIVCPHGRKVEFHPHLSTHTRINFR